MLISQGDGWSVKIFPYQDFLDFRRIFFPSVEILLLGVSSVWLE